MALLGPGRSISPELQSQRTANDLKLRQSDQSPIVPKLQDEYADDEESSDYATAENVQDTQKYILNSLASLGLPCNLNFLSGKPSEAAGIVSVMHALIQQRRADKQAREDLEQANRKLNCDIQVLRNQNKHLDEKLGEKIDEVGSLTIKVRQSQNSCRSADSRANTRHEQDARVIRKLQSDLQRADTKLKQREDEVESLKKRLVHALNKHVGSAPASLHSCEHSQSALDYGLGLEDRNTNSSAAPSRRSSRNTQGSQLTSLQQELQLVKRASEEHSRTASSLTEENAQLRAQLARAKKELQHLCDRCEKLGLGVATSEVSSLANGQRTAQVASDRMTEAELHTYLATDLRVVKDRADRLLAAHESRSAQGIADDAASLSARLNAVMAFLKDEHKALAVALTSQNRERAQKEAAQQRAAAAERRARQLEERAHNSSHHQSEELQQVKRQNEALKQHIQELMQQLQVLQEENQRLVAAAAAAAGRQKGERPSATHSAPARVSHIDMDEIDAELSGLIVDDEELPQLQAEASGMRIATLDEHEDFLQSQGEYYASEQDDEDPHGSFADGYDDVHVHEHADEDVHDDYGNARIAVYYEDEEDEHEESTPSNASHLQQQHSSHAALAVFSSGTLAQAATCVSEDLNASTSIENSSQQQNIMQQSLAQFRRPQVFNNSLYQGAADDHEEPEFPALSAMSRHHNALFGSHPGSDRTDYSIRSNTHASAQQVLPVAKAPVVPRLQLNGPGLPLPGMSSLSEPQFRFSEVAGRTDLNAPVGYASCVDGNALAAAASQRSRTPKSHRTRWEIPPENRPSPREILHNTPNWD